MAKKIGISELVLRDATQSLHATRMTLADMLPIAPKIDKIGYWAAEAWGGATYDSLSASLTKIHGSASANCTLQCQTQKS